MYKILLCKYEQNEDFRKVLSLSKSSRLIEANAWDKYWGCGVGKSALVSRDKLDYSGENKMGLLLEKIRDLKT